MDRPGAAAAPGAAGAGGGVGRLRGGPARWPVRLYLIHALLGGGLLAVVTPPFANPDEANHFLRADQIARGGLVALRFADGRDAGGVADPAILRAAEPSEAVKFRPERKIEAAALDAVNRIAWGAPTRVGFVNTAIYPPFLYAASATGIVLGRAAGLTVTGTLTLARLLNVCVCAVLGAFAVALAGRRWPFVFAVLTLPMTLALDASVSQDGPMIGCVALAMSLLLVPGARAGAVRRHAVFCVVLALAIMARPPYAPLAALGLVFPGCARRRRAAGCAAILLAVGLWCGIDLAFASVDFAALRGNDMSAQLRRLAVRPIRLLTLPLNTLRAIGGLLWQGIVGRLGWLDVVLPRAYLIVATCVLAVSFVLPDGRDGRAGAPRHALLAVGMVLAAAEAVFLFQYLTWTAYGATVIDGVQGRYFLPLSFPLALAAVLVRWPETARRASGWIIAGFPAVSVAVAASAVLSRYYG